MRPRWPGCRVSCRSQERRTADATLADDNFAPGCSGSVGASLTYELPIRHPTWQVPAGELLHHMAYGISCGVAGPAGAQAKTGSG